MGLNMPARTVLFTNVRKFDGKNYRWVCVAFQLVSCRLQCVINNNINFFLQISSGEYIQMSGRAGRRGIDDKGVTIVMIDEKISPSVGRSLFKGAADPINSAFHLTYNMVLNLMRVEEINPEYMMERSFFQFQNYSNIPDICKSKLVISLIRNEVNMVDTHYFKFAELLDTETAYKNMTVPREEEVSSFYDLRKQLNIFTEDFRSFITRPTYVVPFLQPGRLVYVSKPRSIYSFMIGDNINWAHRNKLILIKFVFNYSGKERGNRVWVGSRS